MLHLKSFVQSWLRAFAKCKPEAKRVWTAECYYSRQCQQCQPTRNALNSNSCHREANDKINLHNSLPRPPAFCPGGVMLGGSFGCRTSDFSALGIDNQLLILLSGLPFYHSGGTPDSTARSQGWMEWKEESENTQCIAVLHRMQLMGCRLGCNFNHSPCCLCVPSQPHLPPFLHSWRHQLGSDPSFDLISDLFLTFLLASCCLENSCDPQECLQVKLANKTLGHSW